MSDESVESRELTTKELNKVITGLRSVVKKAITFTIRRMEHQIIRYRRGAERNEKKRRRAEHCLEELHFVRNLSKETGLDEVIKFALLNTKTLEELYIPNKTPVEKLAFYKVATSAAMLKAIDNVRLRYPNWHQEVPFLLQRFGQQAKQKKLEKADRDQKEDINKSEPKSSKEFGAARMKLKKEASDDEDSADDFFAGNDDDKCSSKSDEKQAPVKRLVEKKRVMPSKSQAKKLPTSKVKAPTIKVESESELHPSWESAKRRKEQMRAALSGAPTAKRIKFED